MGRIDIYPAFASTWLWQPWVPTLANLTLGNGTVVAEYVEVGGTVFYLFEFTFGSSGSAVGTSPTFTAPVTIDTTSSIELPIGTTRCIDATGAGWTGGHVRRSTSTVLRPFYLDGNANAATITATLPFTWAVGDILSCSGFYKKSP